MIRFPLLLVSGLALACPPATASTPDLPPANVPTGAATALFVELVVNGRSTSEIVALRLDGDRMIVSTSDLRKAGLLIAGEDEHDVAHMTGIKAEFDEGLQILRLEASPELLPVSRIQGASRERAVAISDWGAMLNYDAYVQRSGGQTSASLWTEQRIFGPVGIFSNDGTLRIASVRGRRSRYLRYDTRFRRIDEERALSYAAGDIFTQSLPWTTSVRMGGIQIARDYHLRPDLLTIPLPSFAGKTAVPSSVDLFIDGYRQQSADVAPGRFVLDNIPVVNGAGRATIVTTDAVGRQISTTIPFYVSPMLLKPGLFDVAAEIGFLRQGYGLRSFDYGALAASATARRGITSHLTLEAHGEVTGKLLLAGVGVVLSPGRFGTAMLSASASTVGGRRSIEWSTGYSYTTRRFSLAFQHRERSNAFRDLGSFSLENYSGSRRSSTVIATLNIPRNGSFAVAYLSGETLEGSRTRITTFSYSRPFGRAASLFLTGDYDLERHTTSAQLRLIVPFGRNSVSAGVSKTSGSAVLGQLDFSRSMPTDGGIGLDASLASDADGAAYGQGTATWRARNVQLQAGGALADGRQSAWASASGSLIVMEKNVFAANRITDAFAIVSTDGTAGVGVRYENQSAGRTDARGYLFIPNVTSYMPVRLAIDTLSLTADHVASSVEQRVAIRQGAGAVVEMPVRLMRSVQVPLVEIGGEPLAPGGSVSRAGHPDAEIGWDGLVYLEDVSGHVVLSVMRRSGKPCRAAIDLPSETQALARLEAVQCR